MKPLSGFVLVFLAIFLIACAADPVPATEIATEPPAEEAEAATEGPTEAPTESGPFTITSTSYEPNAEMSVRYAHTWRSQCEGENYSPQLAWTGVPAGTQSFAITMIDEGWVHWLQFNIPADVTELEEVIGGPEVGIKALNSFGEYGYGGPCPPGGTRTYVITLYALDAMLDLPAASTNGLVENEMEDHILGQVEYIGVHTAAE